MQFPLEPWMALAAFFTYAVLLPNTCKQTSLLKPWEGEAVYGWAECDNEDNWEVVICVVSLVLAIFQIHVFSVLFLDSEYSFLQKMCNKCIRNDFIICYGQIFFTTAEKLCTIYYQNCFDS